MRWQGRRQSGNVVDRRGMGRVGMAGGGLGCGGIVIILLFIVLGGNPQQLIDSGVLEQGAGGPVGNAPVDPADEPLVEFVGVVLADTEDVWTEQFQAMNLVYEKPTLELFTGRVQSACGLASSAVGPFYCPRNKTIYIDLSFFRELKQKYGAEGDFAQAYVIAHEVGHHVQNLLGISDRVHEARERQSEAQANRESVRLELQADYLAGVWAYHAQRKFKILEEGDIDEAVNAAEAIGDDRLSQGTVRPDAFTHGTSEQRARWFRLGFKSGDMQAYDPFEMRDREL